IETSSGSDSSLSFEVAGSSPVSPSFVAKPLRPEDGLGGFCGEAGVEVGRVSSPSSVLADVSLYQSVEISLTRSQAEKVEVVAGRDSLLRVFVDPGADSPAGARLTV